MIEVAEDSGAKRFESPDDAIEQLSGLHGRVLRIRTIDMDYSNVGKILDRLMVGDLQHFSAATNYTMLTKSPMHRYATSFEVALGSGKPQMLSYEASAIELLQEDSGKWVLIHSGQAFECYLERISQ